MDALFEQNLTKVEGGEETLAAMRREMAEDRWGVEAAHITREEELMVALARAGEAKRGTGELPASFWDLPMPEDPSDSVRRALEEDRN